MWVHGSTARPESIVSGRSITGVVRGWGTVFTGQRVLVTGAGGSLTTGPFHAEDPFHHSQKGYWFHFAVPTPVIIAGQRSRLQRVFVLWEAGPGVEVWAVHVYDGINRIAALPANRMTEISAGWVAPSNLPTGRYVSMDAAGARCLEHLVDGVSRFEIPEQPICWGVGISVAAAFRQDGTITFFSAGADFDVE